MLWLQGWNDAPPMVRACLASFEALNPSWCVRALRAEDLAEFLGADPTLPLIRSGSLPPQATADLVRLALLRQHGGVWADATCYCLRQLDEWLLSAAEPGFFAFDRPAPDRMIGSWFLAAKPDDYIIAQWQSAASAYWKQRKEAHTYYWLHHLFGEVYRTDATFREQWDHTPKISALNAFHFIPTNTKLAAMCKLADWDFIDSKRVPVLKLSHSANGPDGSVFSYLMHRAGVS
jgi:capsular polysaccharide synthesis protein